MTREAMLIVKYLIILVQFKRTRVQTIFSIHKPLTQTHFFTELTLLATYKPKDVY